MALGEVAWPTHLPAKAERHQHPGFLNTQSCSQAEGTVGPGTCVGMEVCARGCVRACMVVPVVVVLVFGGRGCSCIDVAKW